MALDGTACFQRYATIVHVLMNNRIYKIKIKLSWTLPVVLSVCVCVWTWSCPHLSYHMHMLVHTVLNSRLFCFHCYFHFLEFSLSNFVSVSESLPWKPASCASMTWIDIGLTVFARLASAVYLKQHPAPS